MNADQLLDIIGSARDQYVAEAMESGTLTVRPRRKLSRVMLIAAIIALMLMLVGCAAVYVLHLQDMKIGSSAPPTPIVQPWETAPAPEDKDVISLQGYMGSPNYNASKEWFDFQNAYDPDKKLLAEADEAKFQAPERYASYFCYTQEMVDKVDEICKKYHLSPLGREWIEDTAQETFDALGISGIFIENTPAEIVVYPGYYYQDGSFQMEGSIVRNGSAYSYSLRCVMNGSFDGVYTIVGDIAAYDQWEYITEQGFHVSLALNQDRAFLVLDKQFCFVTVNLHTAEGTAMERSEAESVADLFDFTFQPQKIDIEVAEARYQQSLKEAQSSDVITNFPAYRSYKEKIVSWLESGYEPYYALRDMNGDGEPELLIGNGESFGTVYTVADNTVKMLFSNGTEEGLYLCEGNVLDYQNGKSHSFYAFEGFYYEKGQYLDPIERLDYFEDVEQYRKDLDGDLVFETVMTDEEVQDILNRYPKIDPGMKPLSEFPMN